MNPAIFLELSVLLVLTLVICGIVRFLRQPLIIGYILSGVVAGPLVLGLIHFTDTLETLSHFGVALLLFLVGLGINPRVIRTVGKVSLVTGIGQVVFTSGIGFVICRLLGFDMMSSLYMSIALAFSSTIIIMKLLSDKKETASLHGRISIGFLIVQDLIAIALLMIFSSAGTERVFGANSVNALLIIIGSLVVLWLFSVYALPWIVRKVAQSQEFLLLFSIGWCMAIASLFHLINMSLEAGALLAGVALSLTPYHQEISARLRPLRDFFIVLFFILLGSQIIFTNIASNLWAIIILSLFVLIGNPLIVLILMGAMGYRKRTSFLAGLTVAQISEFSLIFVSLGVSLGQVTPEVLSLVTAVGILTIAGSAYMIHYSDQLYKLLSKYLSIFEKRESKIHEVDLPSEYQYDVILFGYDNIGLEILETFKKLKKHPLVVDFDPEVILKLAEEGYHCRYGDANDIEFLDELDFSSVSMVISTIPSLDTNLFLIKRILSKNKRCIITAIAQSVDDALMLYEAGATYVILPQLLGGKQVSMMIEKNQLDMKKFLKDRVEHMNELARRRKHHN
jgi:Kef-type K+ transport system membrane component KefB/Trk K+ transport system NAD-binding subunit